MKVLECYDKDSGQRLKCHNKYVFKTFDKFFSTQPSEYRLNYDQNMDSVRIFRVDEIYGAAMTGGYNEEHNIILYEDSSALGHEVVHLSLTDREHKTSVLDGVFPTFEDGLLEGIVEDLFGLIFGLKNTNSYLFQSFSAAMLRDNPDMLGAYFAPASHPFLSFFPDKKSIYSLMYALAFYNEENVGYLDAMCAEDYEYCVDIDGMVKAIKTVIDSLISIEISRETDPNALKLYRERFMDLISRECVSEEVSPYFANYKDYANKRIKILGKSRGKK